MSPLQVYLLLATSISYSAQFPDDSKRQFRTRLSGDNSHSLEPAITHAKQTVSLEPAITHAKPTAPLEFWEKVKKRPKGRNLHLGRLLKKIGNDYNPSWMAIERPSMDGSLQNRVVNAENADIADLTEQVAGLNIEQDILELLGPDHAADHEPSIRRTVGAFQQWLVRKSSCPVAFEWTDLGEYFWPRYIQKGSCDVKRMDGSRDDGTVSCSWPRGMQCGPADSKVLQILRWHCRIKHQPRSPFVTATRKNLRKSYKCRWIKIPYPVTSSCRCQA